MYTKSSYFPFLLVNECARSIHGVGFIVIHDNFNLMQKNILTIFGVIFLAIGVLGFVNNPLLGIFEVDALHNIIHILTGALALVAVSMGRGAMSTFSKIFGIIYGLVAVLGFISGTTVLGLIPVNLADNVLHLVIAVVFLYLGFGQGKDSSSSGGL